MRRLSKVQERCLGVCSGRYVLGTGAVTFYFGLAEVRVEGGSCRRTETKKMMD